ncbi:MAG: ATP-binding protein [Pyrinomonadaceae bacterium]
MEPNGPGSGSKNMSYRSSSATGAEPAGRSIDLDITSLSLFDSAFDFYCFLDSGGRVITIGGAVFEETTTDPGMLSGQRLAETVYWQSAGTTPDVIRSGLAEAAAGRTTQAIVDFRVNAEKKVAVELRFRPLDLDGRPRVVFVSGRVAEAAAEPGISSVNEFLTAAESAEIGLWLWDLKRGEMAATPKVYELLGLSRHDSINEEVLLSTVHPEDRERLEASLRRSIDGAAKFGEEFRVVYPDGVLEWICAEGKAFFDEDGSPHKMTAAIRRITSQKTAEQELTRVYDLEKKARDEAVEANRAKDFFLAFVSHEMRSPLNAILGWAKILLTKQVDEATRRNALETIERSARAQSKLINDLVDSARVASGKISLEFRPTNLYEVVKVSFNAQKPAAEARNIDLEFNFNTDEAVVFGDANRLQQVFNNLITNAIKFTDDGGRITVDLTAGEDTVEVRVADNGRGISPEALPNIFKQFSQGDPSNDIRKGGLGLGLSIANILISKHGGTVQAMSQGLGHGSTFVVRLPLKQVEDPAEDADSPQAELGARPLRGVRLLVVEDDADSREVLQLFLEQAGAEVRSVDSARSAMAALAEMRGRLPDVVISDLAMPEEDGYSLLRRLRGLPSEVGGQVPALALSAFAGNENKQRAYEAGFDGYCTKPFDPDILTRAILQLNQKG